MTMTMHRHPVWTPLAAAAALAVSLSAGCARKPVEEVASEEEVPVAVKEVTAVPVFEVVVATTGIVTPAPGADWTITAPEPSRIAELPHAEGERVRDGDLLVRFDNPNLAAELAARQSDIEQQTARLDTAKAARARLEGLVRDGIAAQKDLDAAKQEEIQAQAALKQAQAALATTNVLISRTNVKARFAGIVARRWHNVGDWVDAAASDPVLRVIDPERLEVVASVPAADLSHISLGHAARVHDPGSTETEAAKVVSAPAAVDPASATAEVRLAFARRTRLAAGTPVSVDIITSTRQNVLAVPTVAIVRDGAEVFVMVAGQDDDKAHKTPVTLGVSSGDLTEVLKGVKGGDLVIVRGQAGLPDEAAIVVVK